MAAPAVAAVGLGASALGGLTSAFGSFFGGQAQAGMYNYQAGVAQMNQQIAAQNANYATYAGEVQAQQAGMKARAQIATTRAEQGAGGLDISSGSPAAVQKSEYDIAQEDIGLIRSDAAKKAYGYEVEAYQYGTQVSLDKYAAANVKTAGELGAIGSLLGGASSVSSKWLSPSNPLQIG